jgi:hypothetical protein
MGKIVTIGLSLIILTIGLGIAFHNVRMIMKAKAREGAQAPATIVLSEMGHDSTRDGIQYWADFEFEFYAAGELIVGGCKIYSRNPSVIRKYKKGHKIVVYYDPEDPYETTLSPGIPRYRFIFLGLSLVLILPGLIGFLSGVCISDDTGTSNREQVPKISSWRLGHDLEGRLMWIGFSFMVIIAGLIGTYPYIQRIVAGNKSKTWTPVPGTIVSSTMEKSSSRSGPIFTPDVKYEYAVGDELMVGNLIKFGGVDDTFDDNVEKYLIKYKKGKKVVVYYNPNHPQESVLEPGINTSMWYGTGLGLLVTGGGLFFFPFSLPISSCPLSIPEKTPKTNETRKTKKKVKKNQRLFYPAQIPCSQKFQGILSMRRAV